MVKQLILCSAYDLPHLWDVVRGIKEETLLLASASKFDEFIFSQIAAEKVKINLTYNCDSRDSKIELFQDLVGLERAYFVVSDPVMSSTAYQAMIYSLYPRLLQVDCWKIMLDENPVIPLGFAFLRNLPEGMPEKNAPLTPPALPADNGHGIKDLLEQSRRGQAWRHLLMRRWTRRGR